jgi:hypothetical protein
MTGSRLFLLALIALVPVTRAGELDDALLDHGLKLLTEVRLADVKTVGVLPFAVQRGTAPASRDFTPLATNLTTRIENVLIFRQNVPGRSEVRVLRVHPKALGAWDAKKADFDRLFSTAHPTAWGDVPAKADAFLTGTVRLSEDRKTAKVAFQLVKPGSWDAGKLKPTDLLDVSVKADPALLRDLAFAAVTSRAVKRPGTKKPEPTEPVLTPADIAGMKFEVRYNGKTQEIKPVPGGEADQPVYAVPAPKAGEKVVFYLTRVAGGTGTLGVVVKVGGKSLFEEQDMDSLACRKWLFEPKMKKPEPYAGFYFLEGGKLKEDPFTVVESPEDERSGARSGWIDIDVFVSRPDDEKPADGELLISTRGVGKGKKPATLAEARERLAKVNGLKVPVIPGGTRQIDLGKAGKPVVVPVSRGKFVNPVRAGGISIRFLSEQTKVID